MASIRVGYNGLQFLVAGNTVIFRTGQDEHRIEAQATIAWATGIAGAYIHIDEFLYASKEMSYGVGDVIYADALELYIKDDSSDYLRRNFLINMHKAGLTVRQIADILQQLPDANPDKSFFIQQFKDSLPPKDKGKYF